MKDMKGNWINFCIGIILISGSLPLSAWTTSAGMITLTSPGHKMAMDVSASISVEGEVVDEDGLPLIGVNIQVKGTNQGTATDFDGRFSLEDIDEDAILVLSYIGYQTQEVPVSGQSTLKIVMTSDSQLLDEVVVVGDRKSTRLNSSHVAISYAVFCLKKKMINKRAVIAIASRRDVMSEMPSITS